MAFPIARICMLQGPPGTGKSHTIVGIIKEILNVSPRSSSLVWENSWHMVTPPLVSLRNDVWGATAEKKNIMMTYHYPDLWRAFDWMKQILNQSEALTRFRQLQMSSVFWSGYLFTWTWSIDQVSQPGWPGFSCGHLEKSFISEIATRRYLENQAWLTGACEDALKVFECATTCGRKIS